MKTEIAIMRRSRANFLSILNDLTISELNTIPIGFNNNVIWNIAHIISTADILAYKLNNIPMRLEKDFIDTYKKGTQPKSMIDEVVVDYLKEILIKQVDDLESDYESNIFPSQMPTPYTTSSKFELASIDDVLIFNNYHEGMHYGAVSSLLKFI